MRVAIFSDIHGNLIALDAILADIRNRGGVDAYWVVGDLAALGYDPAGVLDCLAGLPNAVIIRGNTDRYLVTGERPSPQLDAVARDAALLPRYTQVAQSFAWTQGALAHGEWIARLGKLPLEYRTSLPDGTRALCVHAAPGTDDGAGIHPALTQAEWRHVLEDCDADLLFVGHTHWHMDVTIGTRRVVNLGSVSNPLPPDLRASYTLMEAGGSGYHLEHHRVEYDRAAVVAALERVHHPGADFIARHMRGEGTISFAHRLSAGDAKRLGLAAQLQGQP